MKHSYNIEKRGAALLAGVLAAAIAAAMLATSGNAQQPAGRTIILLPNFNKGTFHQVLVPPKHAGPLGGRSFVGDEAIQIVPLDDSAGKRVGTWYARADLRHAVQARRGERGTGRSSLTASTARGSCHRRRSPAVPARTPAPPGPSTKRLAPRSRKSRSSCCRRRHATR
jgi:hypothetical protein